MLPALLLTMQTPKVAVPAVHPRAELILSGDRTRVTGEGDPGFHIVVRNVGREPLRLVQPMDGSDVGWRNPSVSWILPDLKNRPPVFRCGNVNDFEESNFFTLRPGESKTLDLGWAHFPGLEIGSNRVSFTYDIAPDRKSRDGEMFPFQPTSAEAKAWAERRSRIDALYASLTPIRLKSNVVRVVRQAHP